MVPVVAARWKVTSAKQFERDPERSSGDANTGNARPNQAWRPGFGGLRQADSGVVPSPLARACRGRRGTEADVSAAARRTIPTDPASVGVSFDDHAVEGRLSYRADPVLPVIKFVILT